MSLLRRSLAPLALLLGCSAAPAAPPKLIPALKAAQVFSYGKTILFQDNFQSGKLGRWGISENAEYGRAEADPDRLAIVDAPDLPGQKAVRFWVPRALNSFRSELALPSESGFHERWYSERFYVPKNWVVDHNPGADIVMQWHAIPGNWRATFPNLAIQIRQDSWSIQRNYGNAQAGATRKTERLADLQPGRWVTWVVHAKWSPHEDGLLQFWKDGRLVGEFKGVNVYPTIGVAYTPYLKTGIYHPEWHIDRPGKAETFAKEQPAGAGKEIYITDVQVGDEHADFTPKS